MALYDIRQDLKTVQEKCLTAGKWDYKIKAILNWHQSLKPAIQYINTQGSGSSAVMH